MKSTKDSLDLFEVEEMEVAFVSALTEHVAQHSVSTAEIMRSNMSMAELKEKLGFNTIEQKFDSTGASAPTENDCVKNTYLDDFSTIYQKDRVKSMTDEFNTLTNTENHENN